MLSVKNTIRKQRQNIIRVILRMRSTVQEMTPNPSVIIAPHPDDEVLACGGLITIKKINQARVSVVYLTDGEAAHRVCCNTTPDKIALARRRLAVESGEILGLKPEDMFWIGLADGKIPQQNNPEYNMTVERLAKLIDEIKPQEIYAPHYRDCWPDHEAASELVKEALREVKFRCETYYYPVWMWHNLRLQYLPEILKSKILRIDITPFLKRKKAAIDHYLKPSNPDCGKPFCGILPDGFVDHFQYNYEIVFRAQHNN